MILFSIGLVMIIVGVGFESLPISFLVSFTGIIFMFGGVYYMVATDSEYID